MSFIFNIFNIILVFNHFGCESSIKCDNIPMWHVARREENGPVPSRSGIQVARVTYDVSRHSYVRSDLFVKVRFQVACHVACNVPLWCESCLIVPLQRSVPSALLNMILAPALTDSPRHPLLVLPQLRKTLGHQQRTPRSGWQCLPSSTRS